MSNQHAQTYIEDFWATVLVGTMLRWHKQASRYSKTLKSFEIPIHNKNGLYPPCAHYTIVHYTVGQTGGTTLLETVAFVAISEPERQVCKASHCANKQQWR